MSVKLDLFSNYDIKNVCKIHGRLKILWLIFPYLEDTAKQNRSALLKMQRK